jgi:hypothetical protein
MNDQVVENTETDGAIDILAQMAESGELIVNGINWAGVALERIEDRDDEIERLNANANQWITTAGEYAATCDVKDMEIERLTKVLSEVQRRDWNKGVEIASLKARCDHLMSEGLRVDEIVSLRNKEIADLKAELEHLRSQDCVRFTRGK